MKKLIAALMFLCLGAAAAYAHDVNVNVGVNVGGPGVVYAPPYLEYAPAPRVVVRPHCARRDYHCWYNRWDERRCHRHRRDSCYWYPR